MNYQRVKQVLKNYWKRLIKFLVDEPKEATPKQLELMDHYRHYHWFNDKRFMM